MMLQLMSMLPLSNENGLARTPPLGWRSWNLYGPYVSQTLIESIMDGMVRRDRNVDGVPTSLCDLGYCDVGLDDNWQQCGGYGPHKALHFHEDDGTPLVNTERFPDMAAMTAHAHKLGLTAGWYGNNCICKENRTGARRFYEGDVKAMRAYGFDSWKLDGCGDQVDLQLYDDLIRATPAQSGRSAVLVENCHGGVTVPYKPNATWCPWNLYRTSGDVKASYASVVGNLRSTGYYATHNLSRPGCWAYPDGLEVGCGQGRPGQGDPGLSATEATTQFAAWAIVSSPLILAHDVNNATVMHAVWPIISNREAIAVNQAWAGHSGSAFYRSPDEVTLDRVNHAAIQKGMGAKEVAQLGPTRVPRHEYFYKPLTEGGARTAVLLMNNGNTTADLVLTFKDIPGVRCTRCHVRDIWARRDLGDFDGGYVAKVAAHDAPFLVVTQTAASPAPY